MVVLTRYVNQSFEMTWTATNSEGHPAPAALAVDIAVLTVRDGELWLLAIERPEGGLALPGGFVGRDESPAQTAERTLREKTGLRNLSLEQLATFADPGRDPRGWIPSVAHLALVPADTEPRDPSARWLRVRRHPRLAFDHEQILRAALDRVAGKLWWSNVAVGILPREFTLAEAREVYEAIAGVGYDPATFGRDLRATGLVEATGEVRRETRGRPAAVYRFKQRKPAWGAGRRKRVA
jgi:8-oxo-dGTP diphosphatase